MNDDRNYALGERPEAAFGPSSTSGQRRRNKGGPRLPMVLHEPDASSPTGGPKSLRARHQQSTVRQPERRARRFRAVRCAMCSTSLFSLRLLASQWASACELIVLRGEPRCFGAAGASRVYHPHNLAIPRVPRSASKPCQTTRDMTKTDEGGRRRRVWAPPYARLRRAMHRCEVSEDIVVGVPHGPALNHGTCSTARQSRAVRSPSLAVLRCRT
jgi:hypothetical protein